MAETKTTPPAAVDSTTPTALTLGLVEGDLIDTPEAARILGIKERTVRAWAMDKKIPCFYIGSLLKFHRRELVVWVLAQYQPVKVVS